MRLRAARASSGPTPSGPTSSSRRSTSMVEAEILAVPVVRSGQQVDIGAHLGSVAGIDRDRAAAIEGRIDDHVVLARGLEIRERIDPVTPRRRGMKVTGV